MRVFNVAAELAPYSNGTGLGAEIAALLGALVKRGHDVRAIAPLETGADPASHQLARRLKPLVVSCDGRDVRFTRFEGRTASGVNVDLLQPDAALDRSKLFEAFNLAALDLVRSAGAADAVCISWNRECAPLAALDTALPPSGAAHFVAVRGKADDFDDWFGPPAARRVILTRRGTTESRPSPEAASLTAMLDEGRALALPPAVDEHPPLGPTEKASAKAALQASYGLPVRADVPLTYFGDWPDAPFEAALCAYLRGDVQAIAVCAHDDRIASLEAVAERYPDRLTILPEDVATEALLAGADFCAALTDPVLAVRAMSFGTVPIVLAAQAEGAVDLEPSLASGSAIVAGDPSEAAVIEALGRAVSAFRLGRPFGALRTRIQGYAVTWPVYAERVEQILAST